MRDVSKMTVLVVDDSEGQRYAVARTLEQAGYSVKTAATGAEALARVREGSDVVVLDVGLPDMNGFEVCRLIKSDPQTARVPVIFLSATFQGGTSREQGESAGAMAYLFQPAEPGTLLTVIQAALAHKANPAYLEQPPTREAV